MGIFKRGGSILKCPSGQIAANCYCTDRPMIELTGSLSWFVETGASSAPSIPAVVTNVGGAGTTLTWQRVLDLIGSLAGKITATPADGELATMESDDIMHALDPSGLAAGTYTGTLTVSEAIVPLVTERTLPISVVVAAGYAGTLWIKLTDSDPEHTVFSNSVYELAKGSPFSTDSTELLFSGVPGVSPPPVGSKYRQWVSNFGGTLYYIRLMYFYELNRLIFLFGTKTSGVPVANYGNECGYELDPTNGAPRSAGGGIRYIYRAPTSGETGIVYTIQQEPFT